MAWRKLKGKETGKEEKRNFQRDFSLSKFPQIKLIFGNINVSFFLKASVSKGLTLMFVMKAGRALTRFHVINFLSLPALKANLPGHTQVWYCLSIILCPTLIKLDHIYMEHGSTYCWHCTSIGSLTIVFDSIQIWSSFVTNITMEKFKIRSIKRFYFRKIRSWIKQIHFFKFKQSGSVSPCQSSGLE